MVEMEGLYKDENPNRALSWQEKDEDPISINYESH